MTVLEVLEQAKALSVQERKELTKLLIDSLEVAPLVVEQTDDAVNTEHWGRRLVHVLQETENTDWGDPMIADPVEALQAIRRQEQARLEPYWNGEK